MTTRFPLREKRKAQTRASLLAAARELFAQKGYDATTLEEVAERAGLHVQTLYRHFATKQDLATAGDQEYLDRFREALTGPERSGSTFDFWRSWVDQSASWVMSDGGNAYRKHLKQRAALPAVSARLQAIAFEYEDLLTEALARDFDVAPEGVSIARLVACMLTGGNTHVVRRYAMGEALDLRAEVVKVVDTVERQFADQLATGSDRQSAARQG